MKPFSLACEDAFHKTFEGIHFQDDIGIHIWREAWDSAIKHVLQLVDGEKNANDAKY